MRRGFTLLELLVVIAIIGLLSSVVLTSVNSARVKSRDTVRLQHVRQIQNALELYRSKYDIYPFSVNCQVGAPARAPNEHWCTTNVPIGYANFQGMLSDYLTIPHDPTETAAGT